MAIRIAAEFWQKWRMRPLSSADGNHGRSASGFDSRSTPVEEVGASAPNVNPVRSMSGATSKMDRGVMGNDSSIGSAGGNASAWKSASGDDPGETEVRGDPAEEGIERRLPEYEEVEDESAEVRDANEVGIVT